MDWQSSHHSAASYAKAPQRSEPQSTTIDAGYTQLQDAHWYSAEMGMQLDQSRGASNGCCAYESAGVAQHQRGLAIATSQAHSL